MILIDRPVWAAHGTVWSHLVSDSSLYELRSFARAVDLPDRGFDLDHYDVPARRHDELVAAGAVPVDGRDLARRLAASGLRVPGHERAGAKRAALGARWDALLVPGGSAQEVAAMDAPASGSDAPGSKAREPSALDAVALGSPSIDRWQAVGSELIGRWGQPHRIYHGPLHLSAALDALDELLAAADVDETAARIARLAVWFHDAVHDGDPGRDEERSAYLAVRALAPLIDATPLTSDDVAEIERLVLLTAAHDPAPRDVLGGLVSDADLAVLAGSPARYERYVHQIRAEYEDVPDGAFRSGRAAVLEQLLALPTLFHTPHARTRWAAQATANLTAELERLAA